MSYFGIPVRNGLPIGLGSVAPLASSTSSPFSPASFFANGEQGWWYDPSNFATLFQDAAGTTPVTAVEQPVGLQLDLSKGLVLGPELLPDYTTGYTASGTANVTLSGGEVIATADGSSSSPGYYYAISTVVGQQYYVTGILRSPTTNTMYLGANSTTSVGSTINRASSFSASATQVGFFFTAVGTTTYIFVYGTTSTVGNAYAGRSVSVRYRPGNHRFQTTSANRPVVSARVNLFVGTATLATQSVTTRATTHTLTFTGADSITLTGTAIGVYTAGTYSVTTTAGTLTATVLGMVTQADLRETNVGVGLPAYQAVVTSTNYDSTGFPTYIKPNGSNQFMVTNSINFSSTNKMTVWQGVRKLSDTPFRMIAELSTIDSNPGSFYMGVPASAGYEFHSRGTLSRYATAATGYPSPLTNVLTGIGDISGDTVTLRINGAQVATSTGDQGTGNYGNYPAYFYARAGTTFFYNGHDYGSIARGAASTAAQITAGETYINSKTKAY